MNGLYWWLLASCWLTAGYVLACLMRISGRNNHVLDLEAENLALRRRVAALESRFRVFA